MADTLPAAPRPRSLRRQDKRDQQIRRFARGLRAVAPHLDNPMFAPLVRSYAIVTLAIERSYARLKADDLISPKTNELRTSLDVLGRLIAQQTRLAKALNLTPLTLRKLGQQRTDLAAALIEGE